jgi:hypothetical protein
MAKENAPAAHLRRGLRRAENFKLRVPEWRAKTAIQRALQERGASPRPSLSVIGTRRIGGTRACPPPNHRARALQERGASLRPSLSMIGALNWRDQGMSATQTPAGRESDHRQEFNEISPADLEANPQSQQWSRLYFRHACRRRSRADLGSQNTNAQVSFYIRACSRRCFSRRF